MYCKYLLVDRFFILGEIIKGLIWWVKVNYYFVFVIFLYYFFSINFWEKVVKYVYYFSWIRFIVWFVIGDDYYVFSKS